MQDYLNLIFYTVIIQIVNNSRCCQNHFGNINVFDEKYLVAKEGFYLIYFTYARQVRHTK